MCDFRPRRKRPQRGAFDTWPSAIGGGDGWGRWPSPAVRARASSGGRLKKMEHVRKFDARDLGADPVLLAGVAGPTADHAAGDLGLRLAALTDNRPDAASWIICCLNPAANFRRCFPIDPILPRTPCCPLVEPIARCSNSQLFSPVTGADSVLGSCLPVGQGHWGVSSCRSACEDAASEY
jgi:hypothetical protein